MLVQLFASPASNDIRMAAMAMEAAASSLRSLVVDTMESLTANQVRAAALRRVEVVLWRTSAVLAITIGALVNMKSLSDHFGFHPGREVSGDIAGLLSGSAMLGLVVGLRAVVRVRWPSYGTSWDFPLGVLLAIGAALTAHSLV
jgi:hypothetical protein